MALNIISNYAANVAHRNLTTTDAQATSSLAKLSSGSRIVSAKDDAAGLAIGARLQTEVAALKQAQVNAGQAVSAVQIADGAQARIQDVLTRMKTLAVQSSSGQLGATERALLDTEYQSLEAEIGRISADTAFNGTNLINGSISVGSNGLFTQALNVASVSVVGEDLGTQTVTYQVSYDTSGNITFQASAGTSAGDGVATRYTGAIPAANATNSVTNQGFSLELTGAGGGGGESIFINFMAGFSFSASGSDAMSFTGSTTTTNSYKVGTGTDTSADVMSVSIASATVSALGLTGLDITNTTNADAALSAIDNALDTLVTARADNGANLSRLEFASANLATSIENTEAARSALLDLDIASEITNFTSKQILAQAGIAMLAQANQQPQNLLQLLQ